jgi:hypothetical protein
MADRNLPIKFFQKRQKDNLLTEGGGSDKLPDWVDRSTIPAKSVYIRGVLSEIGKTLTQKVKRGNYLPSVVRVKLSEEALAKRYRIDIGNFFNVGKHNFIGLNSQDEVLVKVDNVNDVQNIIRNFSNSEAAFPSNGVIRGIAAITDIKLFSPEVTDKVSLLEEKGTIKVKLFNYGNHELNAILISAFEKYCADHGIKFQRSTYSGDMNIYQLSEVSLDSLDLIEEFEGVQTVSKMPLFEAEIDETKLNDEEIQIKNPKPGVEYPIVGVLDSGVAKTKHLAPWLTADNITYYTDSDVDKAHGTFVAGVLLYGDELEGKLYTGSEGCMLFEAIVIADKNKIKTDESVLIVQIRDAISRNSHIKVWTLSLGSKVEAHLYEFSDFAKALDEIQEEFEVLIVKSAGNCSQYKTGAPKGRIANSADTVRGLVVGSLAHDKVASDLAELNNPSPFTRIGPGPSHIVKPDLVHFGGNTGIAVMNPIKSFSIDGKIAKNVGTSFSTPRVAAIAAGLNSMLNEPFNATLIKALIIHSAKYPGEMKMDISQKLNEAGFGLPSTIEGTLFNDPNEITLVLQDTLEKGSFIDILDFPFPASMVDEEGFFFGEVTVTLVTNPILEPSQGGEYCQSNIDVMFGTYDKKKSRDMSKRNIRNPIGAEGRQNILNESIYSKVSSKDRDGSFARERMLVAYGDKFHPIKKFSVNLGELTQGNKEKYLKAPKGWYLKLEGLFRQFTETKCETQKVAPKQEFSLIVTIRDTRKKGSIYNEVTNLLDSFSFVHSNIKLKQEVRVQLNN